MTSPAVIMLAGVAVAVGAFVQSAIGIGIGIVATPVVTLLDPAVMPGAMLLAGAVLPALMLAREARHTDWHGVSWALAGRFGGTLAGVWVVAALPPPDLAAAVGGSVLAVVAVSVAGASIPRNPFTLVAAGAVSGASGTATSIGGPPVALLYQRGLGPEVRATLALFLLVGNAAALVALAVAGRLPGRDLATGAALSVFAAVGFACAAPLRGFLDGGRLRTAVLLVGAVSAIALIARALAG